MAQVQIEASYLNGCEEGLGADRKWSVLATYVLY